MNPFSWRRRRLEQRLSAYLDGELDERVADELGERLVFDARARGRLRAIERVDELTRAALAPAGRPDPGPLVERVMAAAPCPTPSPRPRVRWQPALLASVGLLLTAGVAVVGLRRRGLV